jgi:uncharacterized protein YhaN
MGAMALPADTDVETAQDIADIHAETAKKWEQFQTQHKRVEEMTRFAEDFSARTQALCDHVAQDLRDRPAEQALQELYMRFQSVQDAEKERLRLHEEQESLQQEFDQATDSVARFRAQLDQACNEARVGNVELIPEAESQASARRNLEQELAQLEERLADFAAGENMNDFIAALDAEDPDSLTTRGEELNRDLDRLREDREGHINAAAELRVRFESLNLHEESIHAAEALEGLKAESEEAIDRYVRLKAAEAVLQVAMERYRRDNQDPLLKRTAEIFRELTLSSFVDLRTDLDDRGRQVLVGIRNSDESVVGVEGMSDGTTDQLFLALRLASIEQYAEKGKALPFIADDILVNFDDARAIAALKVLAEVSRKVQIIFFTHHQHLLELAKTAVPATALFVSTLG